MELYNKITVIWILNTYKINKTKYYYLIKNNKQENLRGSNSTNQRR